MALWNVTAAPFRCRVLACDPECGLRDVRGVDLAAGRSWAMEIAMAPEPVPMSSTTHGQPRESISSRASVHDALGVGARDEGLLVQVEDEVSEVCVAEDTLHGLTLEAAGDPGLVKLRLLGCQLQLP